MLQFQTENVRFAASFILSKNVPKRFSSRSEIRRWSRSFRKCVLWSSSSASHEAHQLARADARLANRENRCLHEGPISKQNADWMAALASVSWIQLRLNFLFFSNWFLFKFSNISIQFSHARPDPPKEHEILMNEHVRMRTLQRAHDKDLQHQQWKDEVPLKTPKFHKTHFQKEREQILVDKYGKEENYKNEQYVDPSAETEEWKP